MTLDEDTWRRNFDLRCWANAQDVGKGNALALFLLRVMADHIGRAEDGMPMGRFALGDLVEATVSSEVEVLKALDGLAERGVISFEDQPRNGIVVVGFVVGPPKAVSRDEAVAHALKTIRDIERSPEYSGEHAGLLIMIAVRCRQRGAQGYSVRDLVQAGDLGTPARLYRLLDDLRASGRLMWNDDRQSQSVEIDLQFPRGR